MRILYLSPDDGISRDVFRVLSDAVLDSELDDVLAEPWWTESSPGVVLDQILEKIGVADLVVAEVTGNNPNVLYEVGVAHNLGKQVVLLRAEVAEQTPFDIAHFRRIDYRRGAKTVGRENEPRLVQDLVDALQSAREVDVRVIGSQRILPLTEPVAVRDVRDRDSVFVPSVSSVMGTVEVLELRDGYPVRIAVVFDHLTIQIREDAPAALRPAVFKTPRLGSPGA